MKWNISSDVWRFNPVTNQFSRCPSPVGIQPQWNKMGMYPANFWIHHAKMQFTKPIEGFHMLWPRKQTLELHRYIMGPGPGLVYLKWERLSWMATLSTHGEVIVESSGNSHLNHLNLSHVWFPMLNPFYWITFSDGETTISAGSISMVLSPRIHSPPKLLSFRTAQHWAPFFAETRNAKRASGEKKTTQQGMVCWSWRATSDNPWYLSFCHTVMAIY